MNKLSQYVSSPKLVHWIAMKRILIYFLGSQNFGIFINKVSDFDRFLIGVVIMKIGEVKWDT